MYHVVKKQTRPSTEIEFYTMDNRNLVSSTIGRYYYDTYKKTGKCLMSQRQLSEDGLVENGILLWESKDAYLEFLNDPALAQHIIDRDTYNTANGIIRETVIEEEI